MKEEDKRINTSIAIIDYHLFAKGYYHSKEVTFYDSIRKWQNIDKVQQARILLNASSNHDWGYWRATGSLNESNYWFKKAKKYVAPALLDVDKSFEIASY